MGFLCPTVPEEYGGVGADFRYSAVVMEEASALGLSGIGFPLHSDIVAPYILHYGSEDQKEISSTVGFWSNGRCHCNDRTEVQGPICRASKPPPSKGDHYVLNGSKTFITNNQLADLVIVVAKTDPWGGAKGTNLFPG